MARMNESMKSEIIHSNLLQVHNKFTHAPQNLREEMVNSHPESLLS